MDEEKSDKPKSPLTPMGGVLIETSFGSTVAGKSSAPELIENDVVRENSESHSPEPLQVEKEQRPQEAIHEALNELAQKQKSIPNVCPRATMELSASNELLTALRYAFREESKAEVAEGDASTCNSVEEVKTEPAVLLETESQFATKGRESVLESPPQEAPAQDSVTSLTSAEPVQEESVGAGEEQAPDDCVVVSDFWKECERLEELRDWAGLSAFTAQSQNVSKQELKYWWILSQFNLDTLSTPLLSAPLQELLNSTALHEEFADRNAQARLSALCGSIISKSVVEGQSPSQTYGLLQLAYDKLQVEDGTYDSQERAILHALQSKDTFVLTPLEVEIVQSLKERLGSQGKSLVDEAAEIQPESVATTIAAQDERHGAVSFVLSIRRALNWVGESVVFALRAIPHKAHISAFLLAFVVGVYCFRALFSVGEDSRERLTFSTELPKEEASLQLPTLEVLDARMFKGMLLDAEVRQPQEVSQRESKPVATAPAVIESRAPKIRFSRQVVHTDGPIEPRDLQDEIAAADSSARDVTEDYVRGLGADMIGARPDSPLSSSNGKARLYRVVSDTNVLSEPSLDGQVLERLSSGKRVKVVRRFGDWLVLSSKDGQPGYILRQDAVEVGVSRS
ncbi:MAG: SH3 domain-containing protein [Bdellovibrionales bacterium]|nr:SH3 domain-containing protein [Bdellovibrionales bacterium]